MAAVTTVATATVGAMPAYLDAVVWACVVALAVGGAANAWTSRESYLDWRWVKANSRNAAKRLLAWQAFRTDLALCCLQWLVCLVRLWATRWPDPGNDAFARRWAVDVMVFTAGQVCFLTLPAVLNVFDRRRIEDLVRPAVARTGA